MITIAHIINPFKAPAGSAFEKAQNVTLASIKAAQTFTEGKVQVELYAVGYTEDAEIIPSYFKKLPELKESVLDFGKFSKQRKLPLIREILERLINTSRAEYLIYTNVDIALMPQFYEVVQGFIEKGHDALLINRRGIDVHYKGVEDLPLMYSDFGKPHPGFDCFVFKRSLAEKLILENVCIGVPFLEVTLVHNLIAYAERLKLIDDLHLTFHLGAEVMPPLDEDYYRHNRAEYETKIYPRLKPLLDITKFPYATLPLYKRMMKWALNPVFRTHQVTEMEGKSFMRRLKFKLNSWRFALLERIK
ncbi:MAG: hypothetical protein U0V74_01655 [Chitinophagales bacterium]